MQGDFRLGDWLIQPSLGRATRNGQTVHIRAKVMDLLVFLVQRPGEVISKDRLLDGVWGTDALSESALTRAMTELRHALDDDAERPRLIETISKRGYRVLAPVLPGDNNERTDESTLAPGQARWWLYRRAAAALAIVAIVSAGLWLFGGEWFAVERSRAQPVRGSPASSAGTARPPHGRRERSLAILPFINLKPDADSDFLSFSLADAIIARLTPIRALDVRAAYTVHRYRTQPPTPRQAAEDLDVSLIMTGSYLREGHVLRVTPQLVDVASNETLYQESFDIEYRPAPGRAGTRRGAGALCASRYPVVRRTREVGIEPAARSGGL